MKRYIIPIIAMVLLATLSLLFHGVAGAFAGQNGAGAVLVWISTETDSGACLSTATAQLDIVSAGGTSVESLSSSGVVAHLGFLDSEFVELPNEARNWILYE